MNKNHQQGFTLIELMIVVAIIGILVSIALPTYQQFIARSQVIESIVLLDTAKKNVMVNFIDPRSAFPATTAILKNETGTKTEGSYGEITVENASNQDGDLVFTFSNGNAAILTKKVTFSHSSSSGISTWSCSTNLITAIKPKGC